jgi:hypothetical protein
MNVAINSFTVPLLPQTGGNGPVPGSDDATREAVRRPPTTPVDRGSENADAVSGRSGAGDTETRADKPGQRAGTTSFDPVRLTDEELALVRELAATDREVRAHEQAHAAVGGPYAGSPSYTYTRGPDGRQYAVGGEVPIDVSPVEGNPEATISKARIVRRAALAPAQPSGQDRSIAARATAMEQQARIELREQEADAREAERSEAGQSSRGPFVSPTQENEALTEFDEILRSYRPVDTRA